MVAHRRRALPATTSVVRIGLSNGEASSHDSAAAPRSVGRDRLTRGPTGIEPSSAGTGRAGRIVPVGMTRRPAVSGRPGAIGSRNRARPSATFGVAVVTHRGVRIGLRVSPAHSVTTGRRGGMIAPPATTAFRGSTGAGVTTGRRGATIARDVRRVPRASTAASGTAGRVRTAARGLTQLAGRRTDLPGPTAAAGTAATADRAPTGRIAIGRIAIGTIHSVPT